MSHPMRDRIQNLWGKLQNRSAIFCCYCGRDGLAMLFEGRPALYHCGACGSFMRVKDWTPKSDHMDASAGEGGAKG